MLSNRKFLISILTLGMLLLASLACKTLTGVLATPTVEYFPTGAADTPGFITQAPQEVTTLPTALNYQKHPFLIQAMVASASLLTRQ